CGRRRFHQRRPFFAPSPPAGSTAFYPVADRRRAAEKSSGSCANKARSRRNSTRRIVPALYSPARRVEPLWMRRKRSTMRAPAKRFLLSKSFSSFVPPIQEDRGSRLEDRVICSIFYPRSSILDLHLTTNREGVSVTRASGL